MRKFWTIICIALLCVVSGVIALCITPHGTADKIHDSIVKNQQTEDTSTKEDETTTEDNTAVLTANFEIKGLDYEI